MTKVFQNENFREMFGSNYFYFNGGEKVGSVYFTLGPNGSKEEQASFLNELLIKQELGLRILEKVISKTKAVEKLRLRLGVVDNTIEVAFSYGSTFEKVEKTLKVGFANITEECLLSNIDNVLVTARIHLFDEKEKEITLFLLHLS